MLSDESLRRQYDAYGEEGANRAQQRGGHAGHPFGAGVWTLLSLLPALFSHVMMYLGLGVCWRKG